MIRKIIGVRQGCMRDKKGRDIVVGSKVRWYDEGYHWEGEVTALNRMSNGVERMGAICIRMGVAPMRSSVGKIGWFMYPRRSMGR